MPILFRLKTILLGVLFCSVVKIAHAQDQIETIWYNQEKTAKVQIYLAKNNKFYGKIIWLKEPLKDGKPKLDDNNPDEKKRNQPILGLLLLKGFVKTEDNVYEDGTIYDPKNGKTYSCTIKYKNGILDVRGYIGISLIGRTTTWTKAE